MVLWKVLAAVVWLSRRITAGAGALRDLFHDLRQPMRGVPDPSTRASAAVSSAPTLGGPEAAQGRVPRVRASGWGEGCVSPVRLPQEAHWKGHPHKPLISHVFESLVSLASLFRTFLYCARACARKC